MDKGGMARSSGICGVLICLALLVSACGPSISIGPAEPAVTAAVTEAVATAAATATEEPALTATLEAVTETPPPETETPAPATETPEAGVECTVTAAGLRVRGGPGITYEIRSTLTNGAVVNASGRNDAGDWIAVRTADGVEGWVALGFVSCQGDVAALPVQTP